MRTGLKKQRSQSCYHNKIRRIEKWYNHILKTRQEVNGLGHQKKILKSLEYFTEKVRKPITIGD